MEIWKDVKGYEGLYEVSDLGRVRSVDRYVDQENNGTMTRIFYPGKILKLRKDHNGYLTSKICNQSNTKYKKIHRLVAESFISNDDKKPLINHKNGVKGDNRVSNLEWVTAKENSQHALKNNLHNPIVHKQCKEASVEACCKQVICLNNNMIFKSSYEAALWLNSEVFSNTKKTHVLAAAVRRVCNKEKYRTHCFGYKFQRT
jgi:hypothetical protein